MPITFLGIFIIFLAVLSFYRKKGTEKQQKVRENFWNREQKANSVRKQDIRNLPYINIPFDKFPIGISANETLKELEQELLSLADAKILNLNGETNTDLKLKYGPANLAALSEYDQNFSRLCPMLTAYADSLLQNGFEAEAVSVLEFGVEIQSDVLANYTMLAKLYQKQHETAKFDALEQKASLLQSIRKKTILEQLRLIKNT